MATFQVQFGNPDSTDFTSVVADAAEVHVSGALVFNKRYPVTSFVPDYPDSPIGANVTTYVNSHVITYAPGTWTTYFKED